MFVRSLLLSVVVFPSITLVIAVGAVVLSVFEGDEGIPGAIAVFVSAAAALGLAVGIGSGVIIGALGAWLLVPYPGESACRWFAAVSSATCVAAAFVVIALAGGIGDDANRGWILFAVLGGVGAAAGSGRLVNWYVRESRETL